MNFDFLIYGICTVCWCKVVQITFIAVVFLCCNWWLCLGHVLIPLQCWNAAGSLGMTFHGTKLNTANIDWILLWLSRAWITLCITKASSLGLKKFVFLYFRTSSFNKLGLASFCCNCGEIFFGSKELDTLFWGLVTYWSLSPSLNPCIGYNFVLIAQAWSHFRF